MSQREKAIQSPCNISKQTHHSLRSYSSPAGTGWAATRGREQPATPAQCSMKGRPMAAATLGGHPAPPLCYLELIECQNWIKQTPQTHTLPPSVCHWYSIFSTSLEVPMVPLKPQHSMHLTGVEVCHHHTFNLLQNKKNNTIKSTSARILSMAAQSIWRCCTHTQHPSTLCTIRFHQTVSSSR